MRLKAGLVTFVNTDLWIAAQAEGVGPGGGRVEPQDITGTGVTAHGDVTLRRGAEYELRGDELSVAADTRELRVAGNPARAVYASLLAEGRWLRFDPITMTVNAGPGRITVDPVLARALQGARGAEDQP